MAEWVKVVEFAKMAGVTRQRVYDKIKEHPDFVQKIDGVTCVNTALLDVLNGKMPYAPETVAAADDAPLAGEWPTPETPTTPPQEPKTDGSDADALKRANDEIERLKQELATARERNDELNRQILDVVRKSQEQTDKILQIADQAQQLERGSQLLLQDKSDKQSFFKRLFSRG